MRSSQLRPPGCVFPRSPAALPLGLTAHCNGQIWEGFPAHGLPFLGNGPHPTPPPAAVQGSPGFGEPEQRQTSGLMWATRCFLLGFGIGAERCLSDDCPAAPKNCRQGREVWAGRARPRAGRADRAGGPPPPSCSQPLEKPWAPGARTLVPKQTTPSVEHPAWLHRVPHTWAGLTPLQGGPALWTLSVGASRRVVREAGHRTARGLGPPLVHSAASRTQRLGGQHQIRLRSCGPELDGHV